MGYDVGRPFATFSGLTRTKREIRCEMKPKNKTPYGGNSA